MAQIIAEYCSSMVVRFVAVSWKLLAPYAARTYKKTFADAKVWIEGGSSKNPMEVEEGGKVFMMHLIP